MEELVVRTSLTDYPLSVLSIIRIIHLSIIRIIHLSIIRIIHYPYYPLSVLSGFQK